VPERATPLAYRIESAAAAIGVGRSKVFRMIKDGEIPARKIGGSTVILREDLEAFLASTPFVEATKAAQSVNK
jgi:excisionase family DNA binding protein